MNEQNIQEVKIDLDKFKKLFPKYIGDATQFVGGGGKRKSKSRKRRKGRKIKPKKEVNLKKINSIKYLNIIYYKKIYNR